MPGYSNQYFPINPSELHKYLRPVLCESPVFLSMLTCADQEAREGCSNQGPNLCCGMKHVDLPSSLQGLRPPPGCHMPLLDSHTPATSNQREPASAPSPSPEWGLPQSQNPLPNLLHSQSTHRRLFSNRMLYFSTSLQRKEHLRKKRELKRPDQQFSLC